MSKKNLKMSKGNFHTSKDNLEGANNNKKNFLQKYLSLCWCKISKNGSNTLGTSSVPYILRNHKLRLPKQIKN